MSVSDSAVAHSPLQHHSPISAAVSLHELPLCGKISLRGEPDDPTFAAACQQVLGAVPQAELAPPQQLSQGMLFWVGPNEWLLHCEVAACAGLVNELMQAAKGAHLAAVELSDYYVQLRLEGACAREVLSRGTPLDVHPRALKTGDAVNTRFAKCSVLLHAQSDHCFDLQVRWSHAEYLWQYLAQAASQYN